LLVVVALLAIVFGALDVGSRVYIEHQLQQRVDTYQPGAVAKVSIHGFPWLATLAESGRVDRITASAGPVGQGSFVLDRVAVTVTGVRVRRSLLLRQRKLQIVSIDTGTATADMTQADLSRLVGMPVTLGAGTVQVTVSGVSVSGQVSIDGGNLRIDAPGLPVSVPIPAFPVLPCLEDVHAIPGHLVGTCTFHTIPPALKIALQKKLN
jgi:hypothetical protein